MKQLFKAPELLLQVEFHQQTEFYPSIALVDFVQQRIRGRQVVVVTDHHLAKLHADTFARFPQVLRIDAGEAAKNFQQLEQAIAQLIQFEANRQTIIVGVGGGAVTDFTGLLASLFMRGVEYGFVPTTILGAVDASIGGKNGINFGKFKNYVGTINQPAFVGIDPGFFATLPDCEFINGFAEVIKYACIYDQSFFEFLESKDLSDFQTNSELLVMVLQKCISMKAAVVQQDAFEKHERKKLNFGHTIGHAIELSTGLPHGFSIAIGMKYAAQLSTHLGLLGLYDRDRIQQLIEKYHLPISPTISLEDFWPMLLRDKKKAAENIDFILLESIGSAKIQQMPIAELWKQLKELGL